MQYNNDLGNELISQLDKLFSEILLYHFHEQLQKYFISKFYGIYLEWLLLHSIGFILWDPTKKDA